MLRGLLVAGVSLALAGCVTQTSSRDATPATTEPRAEIRTPKEADMRPGTYETVAASAAQAAAQLLEQDGLVADYSIESLQGVDQVVDDHPDAFGPGPDGNLSRDNATMIFVFGAYVGETIRKAHGGTWKEPPEGEFFGATLDIDGLQMWPMERVGKRVVNGPEDSIYDYGRSVERALAAR